MWPASPKTAARNIRSRNSLRSAGSPAALGVVDGADAALARAAPLPEIDAPRPEIMAMSTDPSTARADEPHMIDCQGREAPTADRSCGIAVPRVSIATSQARACPDFAWARLTIIFIPIG